MEENSSDRDLQLAERLFAEWDHGNGKSKSQIEIETWQDATSHGRHFDRFIRTHLGVSTSRPSKQTNRIVDLEDQIRGLGEQPRGVDPPLWETQVQHARSACEAAVRVWNDPTSRFRTGAFSLLFVTAWNSLTIAILERDNDRWWSETNTASESDPRSRYSLELPTLLKKALPEHSHKGTRENVGFWIEIRNAVAHRHLPTLDAIVIPHAQAGLLNFEETVVNGFGPHFALADSLTVPLQLSGFRDPGVLASLKRMQAELPIDVQAILAGPLEADPELLTDRTFQMRVAFVPVVPSSGRSADAVSYFIRPGEVPSELEDALERYVVLPKFGVGSRPNFKPTYVIGEFERRTGLKLNTGDHATAGRALGARAPKGEDDRTVDHRYAEYLSSFKAYLYSQGWIDKLVAEMGDPDKYELIAGRRPRNVLQEDPTD